MAAPPAANDDDDNNSNNSQVFRCRHCRVEFERNVQPCPACQNSAGMDIINVTTDPVNVAEGPIAKVETLRRNYRWLIATVAVTMSAPFITAVMHPYLGIVVGVGFGVASLWLGKKAYILIRRILETG